MKLLRILVISSLSALIAVVVGTIAPVQAQTLPTTPSSMTCLGYGASDVWVRWNFPNDETVTNLQIEVQVNGGDWQQLATMTIPNDPWNTGSNFRLTYTDEGVSGEPHQRRYRVRAYRSNDDIFSAYSAICNGRRSYETADTRIFYGIQGVDDCPQRGPNNNRQVCLTDVTNADGNNLYAQRIAEIMQGSIDAFTRVGFTRNAGQHKALDKYPINIGWCGAGNLGVANTTGVCLRAGAMENTRSNPDPWTTTLHEAFHMQQYRYWGNGEDWVVEGQAAAVEDKICIGADRDSCISFFDNDVGGAYLSRLNWYLSNPDKLPLNEREYVANLFWAYITEKYGTSPTDSVEDGMNFISSFWQDSADDRGRDAIAIIDSTLAGLGYSVTFEEVWKDFAVANYAKNYDSDPKYQYDDMNTDGPGGNYRQVDLTIDTRLALGQQEIRTGETLQPWTTRYYEVQPTASLSIIDVSVIQDTGSPVYYTLMAIKDGQLSFEENQTARHFEQTLVNNEYDRVMLMVATLKNHANYRVSINGNQPELRIVSPTTADVTRVGDPTAPDKFRVIVEVLAPDGTPLDGVMADNFDFSVGTETIPDGQQLTAAKIAGQYWFILQAPTQSTGGLYNLQVSYGPSLIDSEAAAVQYLPRDAADTVVVVDNSGSMGEVDKMQSAKSAARVYIDSWNSNDRIGVYGFDSTVNAQFDLTAWDNTSRDAAFNTIDSMDDGGGTAIGDALQTAWDDLDINGTSDHEWALVLLSDGEETAGNQDFATVIDAIESAKNNGDKVPVVHAIAVGPDANQTLMQRASRQTDGRYRYVAAPPSSQNRQGDREQIYFDLTETYRQIATEVTGQQQFFAESGEIPTSDINREYLIDIPVENGASALVVSLNTEYVVNDIYATLRDPDGNEATGIKNEHNAGGLKHFVWQVDNPAGGSWTLAVEPVVFGRQISGAGQYQAQAAVKSEVTLNAYLTGPTEEPVAGLPVTILVGLTDNAPIAGATINATIDPQAFDTQTTTLQLFDDGQHNDGAAGDGLYGALYRDTTTLAPHIVSIVADGESSLIGPFHRELTTAFYPTSEDSDGDGLPDAWESEYGLDPNQPNATADPDFDGLPNENEFNSGTDPRNPDTDGGGTTDGSDFVAPLDPSDDSVAEIRAHVVGGNGQVVIDYTEPQTYARLDIYRSGTVGGDYSSVAGFLGEESTGSYTDTNVSNGQTYCYIVVARDFLFQETQTAANCATPQTDYVAPRGEVAVLDTNEENQVPTAAVQLDLLASDEYLPETLAPGEDPSTDSAVSGVVEMKVSNQLDLADANWQPYQPTLDWMLATSEGTTQVYAQYRDDAGNVSDISTDVVEVTEEALPSYNSYIPSILKQD